jgi:hypothetical protein
MNQVHQDNLKERDIFFSPFHPDREQAVTAALVLKATNWLSKRP